jgi:1,4-dihydroxy-2-naphthoate octaprenyltransferase
MSCGVLNLNNMRDYENDKNNNKVTLVVKMGVDKSKTYHFSLLILSIISFISIVIYTNVYEYIFSIAPLFFIIRHMYFLNKHHSNNTLDSQLKTVALSCFCCSILSLIIGLVLVDFF